MANILVFAEARGAAATPPSLYAISEARRVADRLGATIFGFFVCGSAENDAGDEAIDALAASLVAAGADRILCCTAASGTLPNASLDIEVGRTILTVHERLQPVLTLFPAGGGIGDELGPPLAVRSGAIYQDRVTIDLTDAVLIDDAVLRNDAVLTDDVASPLLGPLVAGRDRLWLRRRLPGHAGQHVIDVVATGRRIVATLASGPSARALPRTGSFGPAPVAPQAGQDVVQDAGLDVVCVPRAEDAAPRLEAIASEIDDSAALALADTLCLVADGASPEHVAGLRAAAPPGTVVQRSEDAAPATLATACPVRFLLMAPASGTATSGAVILPEVATAPGAKLAVVVRRRTQLSDPAFAAFDVAWPTAGRAPATMARLASAFAKHAGKRAADRPEGRPSARTGAGE